MLVLHTDYDSQAAWPTTLNLASVSPAERVRAPRSRLLQHHGQYGDFTILPWAEHTHTQMKNLCVFSVLHRRFADGYEALLCAKLVGRFRRAPGQFSGFFQLLCHLSQGCNKVAWGAVGAAVVITLITITVVYVSSKWKLTGPCVCVTVSVYFQLERSV